MADPRYTPLGHYVNVTGIAMCITDRLALLPAGVPGRVCIYPGAVAWDACECGMLALTTTRLFGSDQFPVEGLQDARLPVCGLPYMVATVEISMLRCVPSVQSGKQPPSCAQLADATREMYDDAFAVWQGTLCCLREMRNQNFIQEFTMSAQTFIGPQGGCAGSQLTVQLGYLGNCC